MMKKIHFLMGGCLLYQQTAARVNKLKGYILIPNNLPEVKDLTRGEKVGFSRGKYGLDVPG